MWRRIGVSITVALTLTSAAAAQRKHPPPEKFSTRPVRAESPSSARVPGQPAIVHSPWVKYCGRNRNASQVKDICLTVKEARLETGQFLAGAALIEQAGEAKKLFRVTLPLGMQLMPGVRIFIDGETPRSGNFIACLPHGCMADFEVTPEFIMKLKTGSELSLQGFDPPGQMATYRLPLADFARANQRLWTDPIQFEKDQQRRNAPPPSPR